MPSEALKLISTGSIFLATGGTTSSSSQNSSLPKGSAATKTVLEGNGIIPVSENLTVDAVASGEDERILHPDDPNSVSPYASTSLIEQLRRGSGGGGGVEAFPEVIPPPPHYPPPPVPPDSPPPLMQRHQPPQECHYAQSDLQKADVGAAFAGAPYIPAVPPAYAQEQYWSNGMCYIQQPVATTMSSQSKIFTLLFTGIKFYTRIRVVFLVTNVIFAAAQNVVGSIHSRIIILTIIRLESLNMLNYLI